MEKYAVIEVGGKQEIVSEGDEILIEKMEYDPKGTLSIDKVLLVKDSDKLIIGNPYVSGSAVKCKVLAEEKGKKVIAYKYRRRKDSYWKKGHRQQYLKIRIETIK